MKISNINTDTRIAIAGVSLACVGILALMIFRKLYWHAKLFADSLPDLSTGYVVRSALILFFVAIALASLVGQKRPRLAFSSYNRISFERISIFFVFVISIVFLLLFMFNQTTFNNLSLEDGIVEWASAYMLFGCCFIFILVFSKNWKSSTFSLVDKASMALLALVFFVMAMEEVSWFQRVLEIKTPESFSGNFQNEMNLHNFITGYVEIVYYFGAFVFLVAFPFLRLIFPSLLSSRYLRLFVARPFVAVVGSIACAYNFDMWDLIFSQVAFFSSIVILLLFAVFSSNRIDRALILMTACVVIASQWLFLVNGEHFARIWEITEYKELLMPLAFLIYSWDVLSTMGATDASTKKINEPSGCQA